MSRLIPLLLLLPLAALPAFEEAAPPSDLKLVSHDTALFVSLRPGDLSADERFKKLVEVMAGLGPDGAGFLKDLPKHFGFPAADVERLTLAARRFDGPIFIVRTTKAYDHAVLVKKLGLLKEAKAAGKTFLLTTRDLGESGPTAFWLVDDRTIVAGDHDSLAEYIAALGKVGKTHPLAAGLAAAAGKHSLAIAGVPELIFRVLDAEMGDGRDEARKAEAKEIEKRKDDPPAKGKDAPRDEKHDEKRPFKLRTLDQILDDKNGPFGRGEVIPVLPLIRGRSFVVTADLGKAGLAVNGRAEFASADEAADGETVLAAALLMAREALPLFLKHETGVDIKAPALVGLIKQMRAATRAVKLARDGEAVTAAGRLSLDLAPLVAFVAAERPIRADANNLKQMALAIHNYNDTYGHMPPRAICDKGGKPLLSWRVAILPFIEQGPLAMAFKLDEPWDSAHNKKLIARMPAIYKPAARPGVPGETFYQVFAGPGTLYPKPDSKPRIGSIPDGSSNTFLVAEASKSVPWTKPDDIEITAKVLPKLGGQFEKFFQVALCDGSVRRVGRKAPEKSLRIWIDPADGTPNPDDIDP